MKTYKGLCQIECKTDKCQKELKDIIPQCLNCEFSKLKITNLKGTVIFTIDFHKMRKLTK